MTKLALIFPPSSHLIYKQAYPQETLRQLLSRPGASRGGSNRIFEVGKKEKNQQGEETKNQDE